MIVKKQALRLGALCAWLAAGLMPAGVVRAADPPLVGQLPQECIGYVSWGGWQATAAAREKTGLGQLLSQPGPARLIAEAEKWLRTEGLQQGLGDIPEPLRAPLATLLDAAWQRPWAVSIVAVDPAATSGTPVEGVWMMDLGDQADAIGKAVEALLAAAPLPMEDVEVPLKGGKTAKFKRHAGGESGPETLIGVAGDKLVMALGGKAAKGWKAVAAGEGPSLADHAGFKSAAAKACPGTSLLHVYVDTAHFMPLAMAALAGEPDALQAVTALGLDQVKSLTFAVSLTPPQVTSALYVAGPPGALAGLLGAGPVSEDVLKAVPADAGFFIATNVDWAGLVGKVKAFAAKVAPPAADEADGLLQAANTWAGLDLQAELLGQLQGTTVLFDAPSSGSLLAGLQVGLTCKSPQAAERVTAAFRKLAERIAADNWGGKAEVHEATLAGQKVTVVELAADGQTPGICAISWAQAGPVVVVGLYPQPVADSLQRLAGSGAGPALVANPAYAALLKSQPAERQVLVYADSAGLVKLTYPFLLLGGTAATSMLRAQGVPVSAADLPTLGQVLSAFGPSMGSVTSTPDGLLIAGVGPTGVVVPLLGGSDAGTFATIAAFAAYAALESKVQAAFPAADAMVPADDAAPLPAPPGDAAPADVTAPTDSPAPAPAAVEAPPGPMTLDEMHHLAAAFKAFAATHDGALPEDRVMLLDAARANGALPAPLAAQSVDTFLERFAYLAKLRTGDPGNLVVGYSKIKDAEDKRLVLFLNGQVTRCTNEQLKAALFRTQKYLGEQKR